MARLVVDAFWKVLRKTPALLAYSRVGWIWLFRLEEGHINIRSMSTFCWAFRFPSTPSLPLRREFQRFRHCSPSQSWPRSASGQSHWRCCVSRDSGRESILRCLRGCRHDSTSGYRRPTSRNFRRRVWVWNIFCRNASSTKTEPSTETTEKEYILPGNLFWGGNLGTVDLLIRRGCFVKRKNVVTLWRATELN